MPISCLFVGSQNLQHTVLPEKVHQPLESDINSYAELTDNAPIITFYNSMTHNRSFNYNIESSFNDMIRKLNGINTFCLVIAL